MQMFSLAVAAATVVSVPRSADAAPFTPGNLIVSQIGTGAAATGNFPNPVFLREFTTGGGAPLQTISMPTAAADNQLALMLSNVSLEGEITISGDGRYFMMGGYNPAPGDNRNPNSIQNNRSIARIDMNGNFDTSTGLLNEPAPPPASNNPSVMRAVVSTNGTDIWVASSNSTRYTTFGNTAASTILSTVAAGGLQIFDGKLYTSSASVSPALMVSYRGVNAFDSDLPAAPAQTLTLLNGFDPGYPDNRLDPNPVSVSDFWFADANTVYLIDARSFADGGGLQKWTKSGDAWTQSYTITSGLSATLLRLAGTTDGAGNAILYATTNDPVSAANGNKIVTITDALNAATLPGTTFTTIATAAGFTAFRGIEVIPAPIPEPSTFVLGGLGLAGLSQVARRRKRD